MHDILRNIDPSKQKKRALLYGLILSAYITIFMLMGSGGGDSDPELILGMNPIILLLMQAMISALLFIISGFIFAKAALKLNPDDFFPSFSLPALGLVTMITICFMVVNSGIAEWNMNLQFPDSAFSEWAKRSEEQMRVFTEHLTNFTSPLQFYIAVIAVAIIPAIGEELIFRGLIQNFFSRAFANPHVAIWITGILFSAIHLQFYGFIPRMLLGVLFGYMYYWSGSLSLAMIAHFLNNGLSLVLVYLAQSDSIEISPEQMESSAPWPAILVFGGAGAVLLRMFYLQTQKEHG